MGARYSPEAVQRCLELYLQFNGGQHDRIEVEMRKEWPGWSKSNLYDKGKGKNRKDGWISLYGWKHALEMRLAMSSEGAATSAELLFLEIETVRRRLAKEMAAKGAKADKDLVYQHRDYCKLSIDALARLEAARDNLAGFAKFWNDLLQAPALPKVAMQVLVKYSEAIMGWARDKYANEQSKNAGSS
jgi:hypothetical protein